MTGTEDVLLFTSTSLFDSDRLSVRTPTEHHCARMQGKQNVGPRSIESKKAETVLDVGVTGDIRA